ncbi:MAG: alpha/beta hydrolase [Thermoanaerobaculia bacterium]
MNEKEGGSELLRCVEVEPRRPAEAAVIWLHGLGADGYDFEPIVPQLSLSHDHAVRFVFPHAPRIPVTINAGLIMPAWYDIASFEPQGQDERGIRRSDRQVRALLAREIERGVPAAKIVLAGFSQGGAIALFTGLRHGERLAGLMALSTYLPLPEQVAAEAAPANRDVPVFQAHGLYDPLVPLALGRATRDWLAERGYPGEWHEYPIQHQVCLEEIEEIGAWLARVLEPTAPPQDAR